MTHSVGRLIDHIHLRVSDLDASRRFYSAALIALGLEIEGDHEDHFYSDELYVSVDGPPTSNLHLAFQAADRAAVDRFHAEALAAGGRDNGEPGIRDYADDYYAAFVLDPDGNNIEAVVHEDETRSDVAITIND